jgi:hypothetical protein
MLGGTFLSFVAGLVTILNPCVLPLVPILVASALRKSKFWPLALAGALFLASPSLASPPGSNRAAPFACQPGMRHKPLQDRTWEERDYE